MSEAQKVTYLNRAEISCAKYRLKPYTLNRRVLFKEDYSTLPPAPSCNKFWARRSPQTCAPTETGYPNS